jgi:hypothetical protein
VINKLDEDHRRSALLRGAVCIRRHDPAVAERIKGNGAFVQTNKLALGSLKRLSGLCHAMPWGLWCTMNGTLKSDESSYQNTHRHKQHSLDTARHPEGQTRSQSDRLVLADECRRLAQLCMVKKSLKKEQRPNLPCPHSST